MHYNAQHMYMSTDLVVFRPRNMTVISDNNKDLSVSPLYCTSVYILIWLWYTLVCIALIFVKYTPVRTRIPHQPIAAPAVERPYLMQSFQVEAKIDSLDSVQGFIRSALIGCSRKVQTQTTIAVDEIFCNIARYAYAHERGMVTIRVQVDADISITFEDTGIAYNPLAKDDPDVSLDIDQRTIGGLGIFMVKQLMDSVMYVRDGQKNILSLRKNIR